MINTISTIVVTSIAVGSAIGCILSGFYKTNKQFDKDIRDVKADFDHKLEELKKDFDQKANSEHNDVKTEITKLSNKIDNMANQYVTVPSFKTYTESISQLLKMMNEKSTHIEVSIDDIREDIGEIFKLLSSKQNI